MRRLHPVRTVIEGAYRALGGLDALPVEEKPLRGAAGGYAAEKVVSSRRLPPHPKSVVDGYAVRSEDVLPASPSTPVRLRLLDALVRPGPPPSITLGAGEAVRIETGGYLPRGADAAVPVEDTVEEAGTVLVYRRVARWENVSMPGEEYEPGITIVDRGWRVDGRRLAALALEGRERLRVYRLAARVLNVGDELLGAAAGYPAYTHLLVEDWLRGLGFTVAETEFMGDDREAIASWLSGGDAWLSIVMGGTSMGGHDYTVRAIESLEPDYMAHGVAVQPGKTACIAVKDGRLIAAISGLPVAALSSLELLLRPLLAGLGLQLPERPRVRARLTRRITVKMGVAGFARVRLERRGGELAATPLMTGGSGSLKSLVAADGYVYVPEESEGFDEGEEVEVTLF